MTAMTVYRKYTHSASKCNQLHRHIEVYFCKYNFYNNSSMFVGLLKNGEFVKICADTLIQFYVNTENQLYKDFIIIPDNNCNHNLLVITQENEIGFSFIQLLNFAGTLDC